VAGAYSSHGVVVTGAGGALVSCLLEEGRLEPPSPLEAMWNSSVESSIMAYSRDGSSLQVEPMKAASESFLLRERLMPPKQSAMTSSLSKRMISLSEKPPHVKRSTSATTTSADEGTIRTSRGKARCKSHFLARQLSVFSAPTNYGVVKITHSSSEVVIRTTKHTMIYPDLDPSWEVIGLCPVVWY
jgi:hypothetical protein